MREVLEVGLLLIAVFAVLVGGAGRSIYVPDERRRRKAEKGVMKRDEN